MKKKINIFVLLIFSLFSVVSYPGIGNSEPPESIISADGSTSLGVFNNVAGGINFWGHEEALQMFMEEVGTDLYRLKIRLHEVQKEGESYTNLPFLKDEFIQRLNMARDMGCRIMVQIYGIPYWLSTSEDTRIFSNNLPNYAKYPPKDFEEWAKIVSAAITRLKDLGLEGINYYEIFGEPNVGSTWYQQIMNGEPNELNHTTVEVMQNFCKIYNYTALTIQDIDPNAKIGGPAIIPTISGIWWTRFLCQEIKSQNLPLDFYSWHWFKIDNDLEEILNCIKSNSSLTEERVREIFVPRYDKGGFNPDQIDMMVTDIYYYLKKLEEEDNKAIRYPYSFCSSQLKRILSEEGFDEAELFLTEWNVDYSYNIKHDSHYGASFIARALIDLTDSYTEAQTFYCLSSLNPVLKYNGSFELFVGNTPKASFNAFKSFAMLGNYNERINILSSDEDIYSIATKDENSISMLATYYTMIQNAENFSPPPLTKAVTVEIKNIPFERYNYEIYLIDRNHSNDFFGSGPELELIAQGIGTNDFVKSGNLGVYGVVLIKIHRIY
ncbi:MAG: hypothetical protein ACFFCW_22205 [Candidatus Hodarchaeota archaeon]